MIRRTTAAAGGLLVLFHAWLLGSQLWDGELAEPGLGLRWLVAAGLAAAFFGLHRSGASMWWGRKAVSIWLLAALLHGPAISGDHAGFASPALPEAVTAVLQIAGASVIVGLGLGLLAALGAHLFAQARVRLRPAAIRARSVRSRYHLSRFAPRPPPFHR